jgi:hypothetical protein
MENQFNVLDVFKAVKKHKIFIVSFVLASLHVAICCLVFLPKQYKAEVIAVPANPNLADKNRLSPNNSIQHLYPFFGSDGDQDILLGFLKLPHLYDYLTTKFNLITYYKVNEKKVSENKHKASELLKDDLQVKKNENNQVIITLWMKDAKLAADICNEAVDYTNSFIKQQWKLQGEVEEKILDKRINALEAQKDSIEKKLSSSEITSSNALKYLSNIKKNEEQILNLLESKNNIILGVQTTPNALYVLQAATIAPVSDKPNWFIVLTSTIIAGLAFSILLVIVFFKKP